MRKLVAEAAVIVIAVLAVGILSNWFLSSLNIRTSRAPRIWSVNLEQGGMATFNLTNYYDFALTVTQASVTWNASNSVTTNVTSGNIAPPHQYLILTVGFGVNWQKGVRYDFLFSTAQRVQVAATATG